MDRTVATGTGFIGQHAPEVARKYETLERCPDELLLFMHHVPYTHVLHSGKTVIQQILIRTTRARRRRSNFPCAGKHCAGKWMTSAIRRFIRESGIADRQGRVGRYPNRIEAENMQLEGYRSMEVTPWEDVSGGPAVSCPAELSRCSASFEFKGAPGWYDVSVQYFDTTPGNARFELSVGDQMVKVWTGDAGLPWKRPNGDSSTRANANGLALRPGDRISITGTPDLTDYAALDYIELNPR